MAIEVARGAKCLVRMEGNQTILDPPEAGSAGAQAASGRASERKTMTFTFDKSYWSAGDRNEPNYCSQQTLYDDLGKELLDHGFAGFNACILACEYSLHYITRSYAEYRNRWTDRCVWNAGETGVRMETHATGEQVLESLTGMHLTFL